MVPGFPGLIVVYIIIASVLIMYFGRLIATLFRDIERKKNITDLLFLKLLLEFIYSNDLMDELEKTISGIRITGEGNVLEIFRKIIPEAETEIEAVYEPLNEYNEIKNDYDLLHENYSWLLYFTVIYGTIEAVIYILYHIQIIGGYHTYYFLSIFLYSVYIIATVTSTVIVASIFWLIVRTRRRMQLWDSVGVGKFTE
ncbi:MAG: hypothetical protein RE471_02740 [Ferroplasma sp.]|uniref:hypothetical protein n=1 Tax=Ferroplasma sp. TaxID=2591003 RepID=UPI0028151DA1|nr:hypothetical protein [Ferroplasma sp.]WMT51807.1 MAG: hypothetical protein RE471_02740 [Ferroplasma sp.]